MLNESELIFQEKPRFDFLTTELIQQKGFKNKKNAVKYCYDWDDITIKIRYKFLNYKQKDKSKSWLGWDKERGCVYEKEHP